MSTPTTKSRKPPMRWPMRVCDSAIIMLPQGRLVISYTEDGQRVSIAPLGDGAMDVTLDAARLEIGLHG